MEFNQPLDLRLPSSKRSRDNPQNDGENICLNRHLQVHHQQQGIAHFGDNHHDPLQQHHQRQQANTQCSSPSQIKPLNHSSTLDHTPVKPIREDESQPGGGRQAFRSAIKKHLATKDEEDAKDKRSVLFDTVTVYHFTRSQGFGSVPTQGGSTLGMKQKHFLRRKLSVDLFEEVRRRSRREILLKIRFDKTRRVCKTGGSTSNDDDDCDPVQSRSTSCSNSSSSSEARTSDSDEESISDLSDISDSELDTESYIFLQPLGVKLRRSLLRASGVNRIDPREKKECNAIRHSRERSGCNCVNQCLPATCECIRLGVNCHVDRISYPCGCQSSGCQNPLGRTEFDIIRVKDHLIDKLDDNLEEEEVTDTDQPGVDDISDNLTAEEAMPTITSTAN